ncbi:cytochrome P450 family protein [Amycolatopsis sp. CA-126428]|uniref:cytochrome P450 family protein n=1 Tax=Amycolatopsis sp. CA-126428 TaxID=2073158 RepID=UPI000CD1EB13|nr:cytochrome P450 [Amycolatopsis sp. CA-126428]
MTVTHELFTGGFWRDPYPAYTELRDAAPVYRTEQAGTTVWVLSRYVDVRAALADPRLSKDARYLLPPEQRAATASPSVEMMVLMDPPDHTRLRRLVSRVFTARRMEGLRPRVRQLSHELVDALPRTGRVDILREYAFLLPVLVICELLGVPAEDRDDFAAWSNVVVDDSTRDESMEAMGKLQVYLSELIEAKRTQPDDALISALISDSDEDKLSRSELVAMSVMLLIAGHETTINLIGNGLLALLTHPEQLAQVRENPDLMPAAVEEFLRWDSPVHSLSTFYTTEDVEYSGGRIPGGSVVRLSLAAANRDPDRFPDAEELRFDRVESGHLAFSHGLHYCLGAQLARVEGQEAIQTLIAAKPGLALAVPSDELIYRHSQVVRGLKELPVTFGT